MTARRTKFHRTCGDAARALFGCAAFVLVVSFLLLHFTVWQTERDIVREPFHTGIHEADLDGIEPARRQQLLRMFQTEHCPCGCQRTLGSCLNHHTSCRLSREIARGAVEKARAR